MDWIYPLQPGCFVFNIDEKNKNIYIHDDHGAHNILMGKFWEYTFAYKTALIHLCLFSLLLLLRLLYMRIMQIPHSRDDQSLNILQWLPLGRLPVPQPPHLVLAPVTALLRRPQPPIVAAGAHKHHLPLARRQQVADDEVVLVPVQAVARLVHEDGRVRLQLVRGDHALARPALDQVLKEFGHWVQVDDEALGARGFGGAVKVVKLLLVFAADAGVGGGFGARGARLDGVCGLDLVLRHLLGWHEEVRHGRGQVQQTPGPEDRHEAGNCTQLMQIITNGNKRDGQEHIIPPGPLIRLEDLGHLRLDIIPRFHAPLAVLLEEIQVAPRGSMGVVPGKGDETELAVEEDDGVALGEEVLGAGGAAGPGAEVVDEADRLLLQRHGGASRRDEDDTAVGVGVDADEALGLGYVVVEVAWRRVGGEVGVLLLGRHDGGWWGSRADVRYTSCSRI